MKFFPTKAPGAGNIRESLFHAARAVMLSARSIKPSGRVGLLSFAALLLIALFLSVSVWRGSSVSAFAESVAIFSSDCQTPQSSFQLGQTACARVSGAPLSNRRFIWVAPDGSVARVAPVTSDPDTDTFALPTSGQFAQVGVWKVKTIDNRGVGHVSATFSALSPTEPNADLEVTKSGPQTVAAGSSVTYTVTATNNGPDAAADVAINDAVPANTTLGSVTQTAGPIFTCTTAPNDDGVDTTTCTISGLPANATASFSLVYNVSASAPEGTILFNSATISSSTNEVDSSNNAASITTKVSSTGVCTLNCPSNITHDNDAGQCGAIVSYSLPSGANCIGVTCSPASGSFFPTGPATTVTCVGDTGDPCSFTVTIHDTRPPVQPTINCPSNIVADEEFPGTNAATVNYANPATTGNCVTTACSPPSGSSFPSGTTVVTCTAIDSSNNMESCSFTVTVNGTGCALICPPDVTQAASGSACSAVVNYTTPSGENCGTVSCSPASGSTFASGVTVVTCTASTGAACSFNVTVIPAAAPTITTCATDKTITADATTCLATIPNLVGEVVVTGCNPIVSQSPTAGSIVGPGIVTVTITAENAAGEAACTAKVTILNSVATTITCPADIARSNDADQCGAVINYPAPTADNACSELTVSCSPASGSFFPIGLTNVLCTATDASGITTTCSFKVTINDTQQPTITCPPNVSHANDHDQCGAVINYASPTASDNCPGVTSSCTPASGTQFAVGTMTVTCTATDASSNTATCSFTVTINDTQPPTLTCPSNIAVGTDPNAAYATVTFHPTVDDNCSGVGAAVCSPASGTHFSVGATTVTCTVTDAASNSSSCSFTVTVSDNQPPTITCPPSISRTNTANQCGTVATYPNPQVTDNQPGATFACSPASGSFFPVGVNTVTCTATDAGGNHASCSFTVTVDDTQVPTISCPANITASNTPGQCSATLNPGTPIVGDNCPGATAVGVRSDGLALNAPYPVGTTTIVWTARDAAGNQASCTQTIVVNDTQPPSIIGASASPSVLWPPNHKLVDVTINYSVADNCTAVSGITCDLTVSSNEPPSPPGTPHSSADWTVIDAHHVQLRSERLGTGNGRVYTITITCTDSHGRTSTQTVTVTVPHDQGH
ncbi:MAG: hypothetical protein V7641_424 [Blastocatellia bacterium]